MKDSAEAVEEDTGDQDNQDGLEGDDGKMLADEDVVMDPTRDNDAAMDFDIENVVGGDGDIGLHDDGNEEMDGTVLEDQVVCNVIIIQCILMLIIVYQREIVPLTPKEIPSLIWATQKHQHHSTSRRSQRQQLEIHAVHFQGIPPIPTHRIQPHCPQARGQAAVQQKHLPPRPSLWETCF